MSDPHTHATTSSGSPLTCHEVIEFLMAYLDQELTVDQKREFDRHLSICPSCVNYLRTYQQAVHLGQQALRDSNEPASGTVPEGLIHAITRARKRP